MTPEDRLNKLRDGIESERAALLSHPLYGVIDSVEALRLFMEHHVFAVWDFMSLLRSLQMQIIGHGTPWLPPVDPQSARFVNEILLAEETDEDGSGNFASHYDLYLNAMRTAEADTTKVEQFVDRLRDGQDVSTALVNAGANQTIIDFVEATFSIIDRADTIEIASAFTFGREDLLPDVFRQIVNQLNQVLGGQLSDFDYYLGRHIELDGDHHGPMAERLIVSLCGDSDDKWAAAEQAALQTLKARRALWDGIANRLEPEKSRLAAHE